MRRTFIGFVWSTLALVMTSVLGAQANATEVEKLAELRRVIQEQQKMIETQQKAPNELARKVDKMAAESASPAKARARTVSSGQDKVSLALSGQVNRGLLYYSDGDTSDTLHVDNDNSSTRLRLVGKAVVNKDITLGAQIEVQMESNSSSAVSQLADNGVGGASFTERKLEVYADSKRLGRVWLGQGSTASDGSSESDLSGTGVVAYSGIADLAGGILFTNNAPAVAGNPRIGGVFSNFDGLGRDDRIRYDTPQFGGFSASTSHVSGGGWDAAIRYGAEYEAIGVKTVAALAYSDGSDINRFDDQVSGSASLLHGSGFSLTFAAGRRNPEAAGRSDASFYYGKVGYIANLFAFGDTAFSLDFTEAEDVAANGDEATSYGAFVLQTLRDYGTELYAGARNHQLDRPGAVFDDIGSVVVGTRVKF